MSKNPFDHYRPIHTKTEEREHLKQRLLGKRKKIQPVFVAGVSAFIAILFFVIIGSHLMEPKPGFPLSETGVYPEMEQYLVQYQGETEHWEITGFGYEKTYDDDRKEGIEPSFENGKLLLKYKKEKQLPDGEIIHITLGAPDVYLEKDLEFHNHEVDQQPGAALIRLENIVPETSRTEPVTLTISWGNQTETVSLAPEVRINETFERVSYMELDEMDGLGYIRKEHVTINVSLKNLLPGLQRIINGNLYSEEPIKPVLTTFGDDYSFYFDMSMDELKKGDRLKIIGIHETGTKSGIFSDVIKRDPNGTYTKRVEFNLPELGRWKMMFLINGEEQESITIETIYHQ